MDRNGLLALLLRRVVGSGGGVKGVHRGEWGLYMGDTRWEFGSKAVLHPPTQHGILSCPRYDRVHMSYALAPPPHTHTQTHTKKAFCRKCVPQRQHVFPLPVVMKLFTLSPMFLVFSLFYSTYMHCYRVYTPLWLWYWLWVHNVLQRLAWGKKILPTQQGGRRTGATSERAEASKGTAGDAGNENWEPRCQRLVRRPVESLKG